MIVAFAGPSLPPPERAAFPGVDWRGPAEAGDLLRLPAGRRPTVCLIDGYFDHRPAVRHKEILLLLSEGARIFGASSIGALRAAEMADFGMVGVGAVYRAYAGGRLTGDDEVALIHGPEEAGWRPLSVPLVDVRATLLRAVRERIVAGAGARAILAAATAQHYADRCWASLPAPAGFHDWVRDGAVSVKAADARQCLTVAMSLPAGRPPPRPRPVRSAWLDALARDCGVDLARRQPAPGRAARTSCRAGPFPGRDGGSSPRR